MRISIDSSGAEANKYSLYSAISADGRCVAFLSGSSNLVTGDTNGQEDIFRAATSFTCTPGQPDLALSLADTYWASFADYTARQLTVRLRVNRNNASPGFRVQVTGATATGGVTCATTPCAAPLIALADLSLHPYRCSIVLNFKDVKMPVSKEQKAKIAKIAKEYNLRLVLLFGSEVSGKVHQRSDIDIAVMFGEAATADERLLDLIADLRGIFAEGEVDLSLINGADPLFLKKILENCELVSGEPRSLAELKMYAFRRYIDHKSYLRLEKQYVRRLLDRLDKGAA